MFFFSMRNKKYNDSKVKPQTHPNKLWKSKLKADEVDQCKL